MQMAIEGQNGSIISADYRGKDALQVFRKINQSGWGLVVKIDTDEINGQGGELAEIYLAGAIALILISWAAAMMLARSLTQPLSDMGKTLDLVSKGILPENVATGTNDEFGQMSDKVNSLVQTLKSSAEFAKRVGEGKLDTPFQPVSENDTLGRPYSHAR